MSGWHLTLLEPTCLPLELSPLLPETLADLSEREVAAISLQHGNRKLPTGELFRVWQRADGLVLEATTGACDRIGAGMQTGQLQVEGDAGAYTGLGMVGGTLEVAGSVGLFAASGMREGRLEVAGDAGDFLGAALPGDMAGMRGGAVRVRGSVGDRLGDRMRRGLIVVEGGAGGCAASRMIGGTLVIVGGCGERAGYGMRRGTVVVGDPAPQPLCTFADNGVVPLPWLAILRRHLSALGWPADLPAEPLRRLTGCASEGGLGELLVTA